MTDVASLETAQPELSEYLAKIMPTIKTQILRMSDGFSRQLSINDVRDTIENPENDCLEVPQVFVSIYQ
jgi:hypothetical protein